MTGATAAPRSSATGAPARSRTFWWALLAIAAAGLLFRAGYVVATRGDTTLCGNRLCGDALYYSNQAHVLGHGNGFVEWLDPSRPAADHPPVTALVLAPLSVFFPGADSPVTAQRLAMAVLGAAVVVAVGALGRKVGSAHGDAARGTTVGLLAAGIAAVNANLWMNDVVVMSETLAALAIALVLLQTYRFADEPSVRRAAVLGALVGLAGLARAELLLLLPVTFLAVAWWARSVPPRARLGRVAVASGLALAVLAPWALYNATRFDKPVLLSTNDGLTMVGANCDPAYGANDDGGIGFWILQCAYDRQGEIPAGADQSVVSEIYRRDGVEYLLDHKRELPRVEVVRLGRALAFYHPGDMVWLNRGEGRTPWASWLGMWEWWLLIVPAVAGAIVLRRRRILSWPLTSMVVLVVITVVAFYGIVRFRLALDLAATVLAAVAVQAAIARLHPSRGADRADPAVDIGGGAPIDAPVTVQP